jgi:hypothetical protein
MLLLLVLLHLLPVKPRRVAASDSASETTTSKNKQKPIVASPSIDSPSSPENSRKRQRK